MTTENLPEIPYPYRTWIEVYNLLKSHGYDLFDMINFNQSYTFAYSGRERRLLGSIVLLGVLSELRPLIDLFDTREDVFHTISSIRASTMYEHPEMTKLFNALWAMEKLYPLRN